MRSGSNADRKADEFFRFEMSPSLCPVAIEARLAQIKSRATISEIKVLNTHNCL
jgi:hypothetical protein